ncbi:uncharacterized protein LOC141910550 [Tubulanus polymorphus]|uniref:uncharacterized protein LOC141910550 n=1 Tax=Tubulanus polymorphus TaxID=672921 RepID=UPI003DA4DB7D
MAVAWLLGVAMVSAIFTGVHTGDLCIAQEYTHKVIINGINQYIDLGQCAVVASYFIRPTLGFEGQTAGFTELGRGCCCTVGRYTIRTILIGQTIIRYKKITQCRCVPCI